MESKVEPKKKFNLKVIELLKWNAAELRVEEIWII